MNLKLRRPSRPLPLRSELDATHPRRRAFLALGVFGTLTTLAVTWWSRHGSDLISETVYKIETLQVYWTLVATPAERTAWTWIIIALALLLVLAMVLTHRFVWRAIFPDLYRLDERMHPNGRAERVGRLYWTRKFQDDETERVSYRLYYKHGDRWFPLLRFDHVDLEVPAERTLHGRAIIRCASLDRDATGNPFRRVPSTTPSLAHPLATTFREREVVEDQDRKSSIVMPGPGMNPEVMRKKWASERLRTRWAAEMEDDDIDDELEEALRRVRETIPE